MSHFRPCAIIGHVPSWPNSASPSLLEHAQPSYMRLVWHMMDFSHKHPSVGGALRWRGLFATLETPLVIDMDHDSHAEVRLCSLLAARSS